MFYADPSVEEFCFSLLSELPIYFPLNLLLAIILNRLLRTHHLAPLPVRTIDRAHLHLQKTILLSNSGRLSHVLKPSCVEDHGFSSVLPKPITVRLFVSAYKNFKDKSRNDGLRTYDHLPGCFFWDVKNGVPLQSKRVGQALTLRPASQTFARCD